MIDVNKCITDVVGVGVLVGSYPSGITIPVLLDADQDSTVEVCPDIS